MSYEVRIPNRPEKQLSRLPAGVYERVLRKILSLAEDPRPSGSRKLRAEQGYRLRVGDHRVVYRMDDTKRTVTVLRVGHRKTSTANPRRYSLLAET